MQNLPPYLNESDFHEQDFDVDYKYEEDKKPIDDRVPIQFIPSDLLDEKLSELFRTDNLVQDKDKNVYSSIGTLLGIVDKDGVLISPDGSILGYMNDKDTAFDASMTLNMIIRQDQAWLDSPPIHAPSDIAIRQYLFIPGSFLALQEQHGAGVSLDVYKNASKEVGKINKAIKRRKNLCSEKYEDVVKIKEPGNGIYPIGFDVAGFEKSRHLIEWVDMVPTYFTRKQIMQPSDLPQENVCEDFEMFISICNRELSGDSITYLWLDNLKRVIPKELKQDLGKYLKLLPNLEVLGLVGAGLNSLDRLKQKNIILLDLSSNEFRDVDAIEEIVEGTPKLRELNILDNPLTRTKQWRNELPSLNNEFWRIILNLSQLEVLNQRPIPCVTKSKALEKHPTKSNLIKISMSIWNQSLNQILSMSGMKAWNPLTVERLDLSTQGIRKFQVGMLRNLNHLNLSKNFIETLLDCGLEQCINLQYLDLRNNSIPEKSEDGNPLKPIRYLTCLKKLFLSGNPMKEYFSPVIFLTQHFKGTNRTPGLIELDGIKISIEERIRAFQIFSSKAADIHRERWKLNMIQNFGNLQIRSTENFFSNVRQLKLRGRCLKEVYLEEFIHLEFLDLSDNLLRIARGLEKLRDLKYLDLSENPALSISKTMKQLLSAPMKKLKWVNLLPDVKTPDRKLFFKLATQLLEFNHALEFVNDIMIQIEDRVDVYSENVENLDPLKYKVNLALTVSSAFEVRSYFPSDVDIGNQYDPSKVRELLELSGLGLKDTCLDLSLFKNLEKLNISNNKFTDLLSLNLDNLSKLKWLDVRNNFLKNSAAEIAGLIDRLGSLEVLALRGNPCMHNKSDRMKILKLVSRLQDLTSNFRILDTEISVAERVEAWSSREEKSENPEYLQFKAALKLRMPSDASPATLVALDLSNIGLSSVDLSDFFGLKKLNLSGNKLKLLEKSGIDLISGLTVLDLRNNKISDPKQIISAVVKLRDLEFLGVSGNALQVSFRIEILKSLPSVRSNDCKIRYIDEKMVTVDEIMDVIDGDFKERIEKERFRWEIAFKRSISKKEYLNLSNLFSLKISNCHLSFVSVSHLLSLKELDLSHNKITNEDLEASGIRTLKKIQLLDISFNSISQLDRLAEYLSKFQSLDSVTLIGNKCFTEDSSKFRAEFLRLCKNIGSADFNLKRLNGKQIGIDERLEAVEDALSDHDAERIRLEMLISELPNSNNLNLLDISKRNFRYVDAVQRLTFLENLDISKNQITSLIGQGLEKLIFLSTLNISHNSIESIDNILLGLANCHELKSLTMISSTKDKSETNDPTDYIEIVGSSLRSLETIDFLGNPCPLTLIQKDAQQWIYQMTGVGPNNLINFDISDKSLEAELFFLILCALKEIGSVKTFNASGNRWNKGPGRIKAYRQFAIFALGSNLKSMDGEKILDEERLNAIEMIEEEERKGVKLIKRGGWVRNRDEAALLASKVDYEREKNRKQGKDPLDMGDKGAKIAGANANSGMAGASRVEGGIAAMTGTLLNKIEIFINFLQVLALILVVDLTLPWPDAFEKFSQWIHLFSFDIDWAFDIHLPYEQEIKLILLLSIPSLFLLVYFLTNTARIQKWKDRFGENWSRNRSTVFALWFALMTIVVVLAFALYPESISLITKGGKPPPEFIGILVVLGSLVSLIFISYILVVQSFRKHYIGADEEKFQRWWFKKLYLFRKVSLFMITILFMPVSRLIFAQFSCNIQTKRLTLYPDRECPTEKLYPIQIASIIFGVLYLVGIPFFFRRLIQTAIKMVDAHGYGDEEQLFKEMLSKRAAKEAGGKTSSKYKKLQKQSREHLRAFYVNEVKNNPMPQTYLYSAYERRFRYFKLFQMFQKVFIVLITIFIPDSVNVFKIALAAGVLTIFASISIAFRPFNDKYEDWMDIVSQTANALNMILGLVIKLGIANNQVLSAVLIFINISAIVIFIVLMSKSMLRKGCCGNKKKDKSSRPAKKATVTVELQKFLNDESSRERSRQKTENV